MVGALLVAYLATRFTVAAGFTFSPAGLALVLATVGFALVGFVDDFLKIRRRRSLGLSKAQKFIGTALVSILFAFVVDAFSAETGTSTSISFVRPSGLELGLLLFVLWAFVVLTSSSNAVNLTTVSTGWPRVLDPGRATCSSRSGSSGTRDVLERCRARTPAATTSTCWRCRTRRSSRRR